MKKYRIKGTCYSGDSWTHWDFDKIVEAPNLEAVKDLFSGYDESYNYWSLEKIEELEG